MPGVNEPSARAVRVKKSRRPDSTCFGVAATATVLCNVTPNAAKANKEIILVSLVLFICDLGTRERNRKRCVAQFKISGASHFSAGSLRNSGAMSPLVELIDLLAATVTSSRGIFNDAPFGH